MTLRAFGSLFAVLLLVACSRAAEPASTPAVGPGELGGLVLQPADVPPTLTRFDEGPLGVGDTPSGRRGDPRRFGRQGGWKARYRETSPSAGKPPLVVDSRVDLFSTEPGAGSDLVAYKAEFQGIVSSLKGSAKLVTVPKLGAETVAMTLVQGGGPRFRLYTIAWRAGNVTASVSVNGLDGALTVDQVLELARKQDRRIGEAMNRAAGGD